jgi:hypothetical protein
MCRYVDFNWHVCAFLRELKDDKPLIVVTIFCHVQTVFSLYCNQLFYLIPQIE